MDQRIDDANIVSAAITQGSPGWLIGLAAQFDGDPEQHAVSAPELHDMPASKSLVETEIMLTAWLTGRGFTLSSPWRTHSYSGSGDRAVDVRAKFVRK
jgi:hypothetical protein